MRIVLAAVVLAMMPTLGEAQDTRPEAKNVDPVVITATKVETPVSETGAA